MKKINVIFVVFFLSYASINAQWIKDSIPTTDWFYDIHYAGSNTLYVSGSYGRIYKSTNRGQNWSVQQTSTQREVGAVYFINQSTGFAITGDYYSPYGGEIFKTTNGGLNWVNKFTSGIICFRHALHFIDANTGYAGGWSLLSDSAIFKTSDGGETWHPVIVSGLFGVDKFSFINSYTGWAAGYGYNKEFVVKTTDGGSNWFMVYTDPVHTDYFYSLQFLNANTGWVIGLKSAGPSLIIKTTDGGVTWTHQYHNHTTNWELYDIQMINENTGWIVGDVGVIVKTTNGGANWRAQINPSFGFAMFAVYFSGIDTGLAVGMMGRIIKTVNGGGPVSVSILSTEVPSSFTLYQNYPNPFNPETRIRYSLPNSSFVNLVVYDALGRVVQTLVNNENQAAGTYEAVFDASRIPSGVYYYRLTAEGFSETRKMVVLK
ncbi:MAG: YCF48-related protein [Ignavibacteria bacterium]